MEKTLAPSVVSPPCASSSAWNSRVMVPSTAMIGGRNRMAPSPVPVGCEQLPVTDGIFRADRTNVKAPDAPRSRVLSGCSLHLTGEGADSVDDERRGRDAPGDRVRRRKETLGYVHG